MAPETVAAASQPQLVGPRGTLRVLRVAGVDLRLHWTWAPVALYAVGASFAGIAAIRPEVLAALLVFTLAHELGHVIACRCVGGEAREVVIWPLGGIFRGRIPDSAGATFLTAAGGPLVNVAFVAVFLWMSRADRHGHFLTPPMAHVVRQCGIANLALVIVNLLPIYPLDGGQLLRGGLWRMLGKERSKKAAALLGLIVSAPLIPFALFQRWFGVAIGSLWIAAVCYRIVVKRPDASATNGRSE